MLKLIAIDMDGTLLDSRKELSQRNIDVIQEAAQKGHKIVICTGRIQKGVEPYFDQLELKAEEEYAVLNNGCSLHTIREDWQLLSYHNLDFHDVQYLYSLLDGYPEIYLTLIADVDYLVLADEVPDLVAYDASLVFTEPKPVSLAEVKAADKPVFQAMYMGEPDVLDTFQADLEAELADKFSMVRSQPYLFEAMPKGITKASGLRELAQKLDVKAKDIVALGDAANDLEMMKAAGFSIAMGNAAEDIKKIADAITSSNDEAGVAEAIQKYVLKTKE
ncbi:Cof-type HAD-IIB family hydrolase [Streptococcus ratti]|uniref:HAD family phosphatase n=1 Tax=Streptococcus ratti TaxID=1341 RepID=A0A7X9LFE9_STRRT|nr:HAD family phosphatase [Streptococcus ratti]